MISISKSPETTDRRSQRERTARLAVWAVIPNLAAVVLAAALSNSVALVADLLLTVLDFATVLVVWWVARLSLKGRAGTFNYGYGKLESLTAGVVGVFMLVSLAIVLAMAIGRIQSGGAPPDGLGVAIGLAANVISGGVNLWLLLRYRRQAREDDSEVVRSQIVLFIDKVTSNAVMILALGGWIVFADSDFGRYIDPLASLVIAGSMGYWALQILRRALGQLIDAACGEEVQMPVTMALVRHFDDYDGLGPLRTRRAGDQVFVEIELGFEAERPVGHVCALQDALGERIRRTVPSAQVNILPRRLPEAPSA